MNNKRIGESEITLIEHTVGTERVQTRFETFLEPYGMATRMVNAWLAVPGNGESVDWNSQRAYPRAMRDYLCSGALNAPDMLLGFMIVLHSGLQRERFADNPRGSVAERVVEDKKTGRTKHELLYLAEDLETVRSLVLGEGWEREPNPMAWICKAWQTETVRRRREDPDLRGLTRDRSRQHQFEQQRVSLDEAAEISDPAASPRAVEFRHDVDNAITLAECTDGEACVLRGVLTEGLTYAEATGDDDAKHARRNFERRLGGRAKRMSAVLEAYRKPGHRTDLERLAAKTAGRGTPK
jgi:hypothetical protein